MCFLLEFGLTDYEQYTVVYKISMRGGEVVNVRLLVCQFLKDWCKINNVAASKGTNSAILLTTSDDVRLRVSCTRGLLIDVAKLWVYFSLLVIF